MEATISMSRVFHLLMPITVIERTHTCVTSHTQQIHVFVREILHLECAKPLVPLCEFISLEMVFQET